MQNDPRAFAYWLQGYTEICGERPTEAQWAMIKEHLQLVFTKVTGPQPGNPFQPPFGSLGDSGPVHPNPLEQTYCASLGTGNPRDLPGFEPNWPTHPVQLFATDRSC